MPSDEERGTLSNDDHDEIIVAYAAGEDVAAIEQRYGVTRDEIEWLVAHGSNPQPPRLTSPTPIAGANRATPPAPIVGAVVVFALVACLFLLSAGFFLFNFSAYSVALLLAIALVVGILGSTAYGVWQGRRGSRIAAIIIGAMMSLSASGAMQTGDTGFPLVAWLAGVAVIALVAAPKSSRAWFARERQSPPAGSPPRDRRWRP